MKWKATTALVGLTVLVACAAFTATTLIARQRAASAGPPIANVYSVLIQETKNQQAWIAFPCNTDRTCMPSNPLTDRAVVFHGSRADWGDFKICWDSDPRFTPCVRLGDVFR